MVMLGLNRLRVRGRLIGRPILRQLAQLACRCKKAPQRGLAGLDGSAGW